ncbi:MAG: hypothetical protein AAGH46_04550 [Bacteroidota bacterium]
MRTLNLKLIFLGLLTMGLSAQQKVGKSKQTISVNKDVVIDLNTNYVEIEIDTWNKDTVEIEAYVESSELNQEELKEAAKRWDLDINGSMNNISIRSKSGATAFYGQSDGDYAFYLKDLEEQLANMPEIPEMPELPEMAEMPEMPEMPEFPELPELPKGVKKIEFDIDQYNKEGQKYLEKWSAEYEEKYGKEFRKDMEAWAKKFADSDYQNRMQAWGEEYGKRFEGEWAKDMEKWGEEFGEKIGKEWAEKMEKWGEEFGRDFEKQMEGWARRYEREMERESRNIERQARENERRQMREEKRAEILEKRVEEMERRAEAMERRAETRSARGYSYKSETKVKKVIKIKIPKKAKLKVNVRHGELTFASVIHNLNADVAYAPFKATEIDGGSTSINVSYAPILVDTWKLGELNLNYVDKALLNSAERIILTSNSSNIELANLIGNAVIDGSFGDLDILNIADSFNNLNIIIENSDARIALPETSHNLQFKGNRSRFNHPEKQSGSGSSFSTGDLSSGKTIVVNAKFSSVTME